MVASLLVALLAIGAMTGGVFLILGLIMFDGTVDDHNAACTPFAERPYLGIGLDETSRGLLLAPWIDSSGRPCPAVAAGGPADNAGLRAGDIISAIDGTAVRSLQGIRDIIARRAVGDVLTLTVLRDASELTVSLTLGAGPPDY